MNANVELETWMNRDLAITLNIFRRLVAGLCAEEIQAYMKFVEGVDKVYERLQPGTKAALNEMYFFTPQGLSRHSYGTLEMNFYANSVSEGQWNYNSQTIYEYIKEYRPQLWAHLNKEWCQQRQKLIDILAKAPPLDRMTKH